MFEALFWLSLVTIAIVYVGYPGLMALLGSRTIDPPPGGGSPTVGVAIAAHNEEEVITRKIQSCLEQDYPREKLTVVVVSDGSTDQTVARARSQASERVRVIDLSENVGKAMALNAAIDRIGGEVVILTDARQPLQPDAVRHLVAHFRNPAVGCVSGDLRYERHGETGMQRALHRYWDYEKNIRLGESRVHSCVGATGALYGIRRYLWRHLPPGLLLDDVFTPMQIVLSGYRTIFEPRAWAADIASSDDDFEYQRRVRTLTGNYQLLVELPAVLNPLRNPIWLQYVIHKLGRLATPFLLLGLLVGAALATGPFYGTVFALQVVFWGLVGLLGMRRSRLRFARFFALPYAFAITQAAAMHALLHSVRGNWRVWGNTR